MHQYELVLIFQADLDQATLDTAVENVEAVITNAKGEIAKTERWGKRRLAYPISKMNEGYYTFISFQHNPEEIAGLKRVLGYNEQVLRSSIIRVA